RAVDHIRECAMANHVGAISLGAPVNDDATGLVIRSAILHSVPGPGGDREFRERAILDRVEVRCALQCDADAVVMKITVVDEVRIAAVDVDRAMEQIAAEVAELNA